MSQPQVDPPREHLLRIQREYYVLCAVVAILVEQLLKVTGGDSIEISDVALGEAPDLQARRNTGNRSVELSVSR